MARPPAVPPGIRSAAARIDPWLVAALPGVLVVFFAFRGGGFFPTSHTIVIVGLLLVMMLRATLAPHPFAGLSRWGAAVAVPLALFALWTLLSGGWGPEHRALLEYDRALLYVAGFVVLATLPRTEHRSRWTARLLLAGIVVVCGSALITRLLPEVWPIDAGIAEDRLSYPITYWNALGLLAGFGTVVALSFAASAREAAWLRVAGAAVLPALTVTLFLTFSRGAMAATAIGLLVLLAVLRSPGWASAALAAGPACAGALLVAIGADAIASDDPASPAGVDEGRGIAVAIALATAFAAGVRYACLRLDARLIERRRDTQPWPRRRVAAAWAGGAALAVAAALLAGGAGFAERQVDRFLEGNTTAQSDLRDRLLDPGNNGRLEEWRVALKAFRQDRIRGTGAGTYQNLWSHLRPVGTDKVDAHSLYVEVLGELGLVGFALVLATVLALLVGLATRTRGVPAAPAVFAVAVAWALHAGVDWDWEMPVLTFTVLAAAASVLAHPPGGTRVRTPGRSVRVGAGLGCLLLALTPIAIYRSQQALDDAVNHLRAGECGRAIDRALASTDAVSSRPEPFEVIGYCDVRLGEAELAERAMREAVKRDPTNWEFRYGLALVLAAFGKDPRVEAELAYQLNPRGLLAVAVAEHLNDTDDPKVWRVRARELPLPGY